MLPGRGAGTFSLEPPGHFNHTRNRSRPKIHFSASLFKIFARQGWVPGIYRLGDQIRLVDLAKLENNIETRALLKEDAQMRVSFKKCWMDMPPVEIGHSHENFL